MDIIEFPGGLDNKQFRLLVLKTTHSMKRRLALSSLEKELAELLNFHADLSVSSLSDQAILTRQYDVNELNPFLHLAAHLEIRHQIEMDRPKGVRDVHRTLLTQGFDEHTAEEIMCVALTYILLYEMDDNELEVDLYLEKIEKNSTELGNKQFVEEMPIAADNYVDDEDEVYMAAAEASGFITPRMFDYIKDRLVRDMHEEASTKSIKLNTTLKAALNKLPSQWIDAIAAFHKRPNQRTKRDRVVDLCSYLTKEENLCPFVEQMEDDETEALDFILTNDGWHKYGKLSKDFGDESEDSYWWTEEPPESIIGRLRLKGFVTVGKAPIGSRRYKVAVVPVELREGLKKCLS